MGVRVLGTLEVVAGDGTRVPLASPKLRRLLAALLVNAGSVVSVDRLADVVWGDDPPGNATGALHNLVSRLRGKLRPLAAEGVELATRAPGYVLTVERSAVDASRFGELVEQARAATDEPGATLAAYDQALALWRGDAYAEFRDEPFARAEASRLGELCTTAVGERIEATLALGRTDDAIAQLEPLIDAHPLRERPRALLMVALYRAGRQADALAAYRGYREVLGAELGLEPSADLQGLEQRILQGDPQLGGPATAADLASAASATAVAPGAAETSPADGPPSPRTASGRRSGLPPAPELIGREALVAQVCGVLEEDGGPVTLIGPGGVGKTSVALRAAALPAPRPAGRALVVRPRPPRRRRRRRRCRHDRVGHAPATRHDHARAHRRGAPRPSRPARARQRRARDRRCRRADRGARTHRRRRARDQP